MRKTARWMKRPRIRRRQDQETPEATEPLPAAPAPGGDGEASPTRDGEAERGRSRSRPAWAAAAALGLLLIAAAGVGGYLLGDEDEPETTFESPAPAPTVIVEQAPEPEAADQLGFPGFATRNTTRVGGADATAVAAGVALASYPSLGGVGGPNVVALAPTDSWQIALASSSLAAEPVAAPILLGEADAIPEFTAAAYEALSPAGIGPDEAEVIAIGDVAVPDGAKTLEIAGDDPAEVAKAIDAERAKLSKVEHPDHLLVVPLEAPEFAMPAAAWAARSGDPILFAAKESVPEATIEVIERHPKASVYVLGPPSAIGGDAFEKLEKAAGDVRRVGATDAVENAIAFARFSDGSFGWEIADPGHGFVLANTARPLDAAAAAPLAAGGKPGPLLLTDDANEIPEALRGFLLDTKPGYIDDPERALYNHLWLLGDSGAISLRFQAQADELTKLVQVREGTGGPRFQPGTGPEAEPEPEAQDPPRP